MGRIKSCWLKVEQSVAGVKQFAGKMQIPDVGRSFNSFLRVKYNIWEVETGCRRIASSLLHQYCWIILWIKEKRRVEEDVNFDVHFHFKISFQFCVATKTDNDVIACYSLVVNEKMNIFCDDDWYGIVKEIFLSRNNLLLAYLWILKNFLVVEMTLFQADIFTHYSNILMRRYLENFCHNSEYSSPSLVSIKQKLCHLCSGSEKLSLSFILFPGEFFLLFIIFCVSTS